MFSLEGCIAGGSFDRLREFEWSVDVTVPLRYRFSMRMLRLGIGAVLWWSRFGLTALGWLGWVVVAGMLLKRALQRFRRL